MSSSRSPKRTDPGDPSHGAASFPIERFECDRSRDAIAIISRLTKEGYVAYLAGGCVRDALLDQAPKDYDVATDATPSAVRDVFGKSRTIAFGASFGVIGVLPEKRSSGGPQPPITPTEVATFRSDGVYSDGRRPDSVHYGNAEQDALRRDFTINGMFYDPGRHEVIDFVGGQIDLRQSVLRTIGDAHQRFGEDKLRMLRAVRFATTLGFRLDHATHEAVIQHAESITVVSAERIGAEMRRVLTAERAMDGLLLLEECGLSRYVLPEWGQVDQTELTRLLENLPHRDISTVLACFLISMPSSPLAAIAKRWRLSNEEQRQINSAIVHHDAILSAHQRKWSVIQPILIDRDIEVLLPVAEAVARTRSLDPSGLARVRGALAWPPETLDPPPLLTGQDLMEMGVEQGPEYRKILQSIRDAQLDGLAKTRADAEEIVRSHK